MQTFEEERREEIIGGKVVVMLSPTLNHNYVTGNLYVLFRNYLDKTSYDTIPGGTTLFLEDDVEEYKPDMMVVCDPEKLKMDGIHGAPDLVVEVLSPKTARNDRGFKKDAYERHGVREYWIVSPAERTIEQYVLRDGRFVLHNVYAQFPQFMLDDMTEEERAAVVTEFQSVLFDDLTIRLEDVFKRVT